MDNEYQPFPDEEMQVRIMVGDKQAIAYKWIEAYAENLTGMISQYDDEHDSSGPVTVSELVHVGMSRLDDENSWKEYLSRGGAFEGARTDPTFWEKLSDLKGVEIPPDSRSNFFSCSC